MQPAAPGHQVGALLMLVLYIYSYMGVLLFGTMKRGEALSEHANFSNFPIALLTLIRLATNDNWNDLLAVRCVSCISACAPGRACAGFCAPPGPAAA